MLQGGGSDLLSRRGAEVVGGGTKGRSKRSRECGKGNEEGGGNGAG